MAGPLALRGTVTSAGKMAKTCKVTVSRKYMHPIVGKVVQRSKKYMVHDPAEEARLGDKVIIQNCRPISAQKTFQLVKRVAEARTLEAESAKEAADQAAHVAAQVS